MASWLLSHDRLGELALLDQGQGEKRGVQQVTKVPPVQGPFSCKGRAPPLPKNGKVRSRYFPDD